MGFSIEFGVCLWKFPPKQLKEISFVALAARNDLKEDM